MVFWLAILGGGLFAWFAVKLGFYDTWALLFNIVIAIYMAVFLTPVIAEFIPAADEIPYSTALTLIVIAAGAFFILFGISYTLITGQFNVPFPRIFDVVFAGLLGFLAGFLVFSFAAFLICVTPISENKCLKEIGLSSQSQQANISYICWWCDLVNSFVASEDSDYTAEKVIGSLLQKTNNDSVENAEPENLPDDNDTGANHSDVSAGDSS